jgi:hypothetical protein
MIESETIKDINELETKLKQSSLDQSKHSSLVDDLQSICGSKKFNNINQNELTIISKKTFKEKVKTFYLNAISSELNTSVKR